VRARVEDLVDSRAECAESNCGSRSAHRPDGAARRGSDESD
jgi:hypothetical protein